MTGVLATDRSYASGSGVYSLKDNCYNEKYIRMSGIDKNKLPTILNSTDVIGPILPEIAEELGLSSDTLVCAGGVDNACMALGAGCSDNGDVYTSIGTSGWIAVSDEIPVVDLQGRPYVFAHCVPRKYVSSVAIFSAGNSLKWARDNIFVDLYANEISDGISSYSRIDELAMASIPGANKLFFIPTLAGGSSLDKSANARGCFLGLDLMHTREDIARAILEGIALNLRVALDVFKKHISLGENMLMVGGGSKSTFWKQIFADVYGMSISTARVGQDAGSFGAAALAFIGVGIWKNFEKAKFIVEEEELTQPTQSLLEFYESILPVYKELLDISADVGEIIKKI